MFRIEKLEVWEWSKQPIKTKLSPAAKYKLLLHGGLVQNEIPSMVTIVTVAPVLSALMLLITLCDQILIYLGTSQPTS